MGGILLDAKAERRGPLEPPTPTPLHLKAAIISLTMTQFTVSMRLPSRLVSISAVLLLRAIYLMGRVTQELVSEGLKR